MASSLVLATFALVICGCFAADYGWQPQKEFQFRVQGQDVAGLPQLKPQYTGFRYKGELRVQTHSSRVLLLKLFNMSYTKIHQDLPRGWWKGPEARSNKTRQLPITTSTIIVKLSKSMSPELIVQSGLDDWQINFIKGIVSHLMVYLNDNSPSGHYFNKLTNSQTSDVYSVFEDSVSGRCEVMYEVNPYPRHLAPHNQRLCNPEQPLWEITKTRNFSNCQVLSENHAHLPSSDCQPGAANCGRFWTRASLTQMIGCGEMNNMLLLSSVSSSAQSAQLHLENSTQAVVDSNLNITLTSVLDLKSKFNAPSAKQSTKTLLYSYSPTPKEFSSQKCEDTASSSQISDDDDNDNNHSRENTDSRKQINPTKNDDKKDVDGNGMGSRPESRNRRAIRYDRYRTTSNELQENGNSDKQPKTYKQKSKRYNAGKSNSKKHGLKAQKNDDWTSTENDQFISAEKDDNTRRNIYKNQPSEEPDAKSFEDSYNQHSEEMDLEEHWKISVQDTKELPPHQPFNLFALSHRTSYDLSCLNSKLRQMINDIANDLKEINALPEKNTMEKLSIAVDICRLLPFDQLSTISEEIFEIPNGASNIIKNDNRKIFRDVIAMCGSHPALKIIKGWVERQQLEGEEAAQVISSLPNQIISPNKYLIQDYFDMVQQISEGENEQLVVTAVLSFSNLVRVACVNQGTRVHRFSSINKPVCDESYMAKYVDWLSHKISSDAPLRRAYIEAIGNVGSPHVIEILKSIAVNPKYSSYYRTSAVFAMRYQALKKSPQMAPLLMSLYHNYSMPASTRIASAALLFYSNPGLAVWQRLAISTWYEPSTAVAQFVSSSLHNIARAKDSLYGQMTRAAALVQPLSRPSKISTNQPFNMMTTWLSSDLEKLVFQQLSWMHFSDFSNLYYRHSSRYSGFSRTNIQASYSFSNADDLWSALQDVISSVDDSSARSSNLGASHKIADIEESLGLHPRSMPFPQGEIHLKINNVMERMFLINRDTIQSLAQGGRKLISEILREGKSLSYQKADMDGFHISTTTEMGFPVEFSLRTPWMVRSKGNINATLNGLSFEVAFMYSAQMLSSLSVMSPWDSIAHMAGGYATNFVQLPTLRLVASIDSATDSVKVITNNIDQHRLVYFDMQPFTSQRRMKIHQPVLLSPDTMNVKIGEPVQIPIPGMGRYLNTVYSSERSEHFSVLEFFKQARGVVGFSMVFRNMESRTFETVMNSLHPVTMNFSMSMASKSMGVMEYGASKDTLVSRILSSLDKIVSMGQSPVMSAFRFFGGLFGGSEESSTTETPSGDNRDNLKFNGENPHVSPINGNTENGKEGDSIASVNTHPKDQVYTTQEQTDKMNPTTKVYTTTYETAVGTFNASQITPFANPAHGSASYYLLGQSLSKINSGSAVVYAFDMQSASPERPIKISAYATYASTYSGRVQRLGLFIKKDQTQTKLTAVHEDPVDISFDLQRRINENLQHNLFFDFVHTTSNEDARVFMKAKLGVSRAEMSELRDSPILPMCSKDEESAAVINFKCQQLRERAKQISFGNITINYNNDGKYVEQMFVKYINAAKVMIPGTEEKAGKGYNTIQMVLEVDQKTRSVDMFVTTPVTSVKIHQLALSSLPMSTLAEWATQADAVQEYCGISPTKFRTFDGREVSYDLVAGWHLVLHDRTRKYGISILAQSSSNNTMEIEINKDDQAVLRVEEGLKVYVNGQSQPLGVDQSVMIVNNGRGQMLMHTVYTPDGSLHIQIPSQQLDLKLSNATLIIRAGSALQGRLCGICGSNSNTGVEQYITAGGKPARSALAYAASFRLKNSTQQSDEGPHDSVQGPHNHAEEPHDSIQELPNHAEEPRNSADN